MGYQGKNTQAMVSHFNRELEIVKRPRKYFWVPEEIKDINSYLENQGIDTSKGFKVLPNRWIVERTFAWLGRYRRLSKDYEFLPRVSEAFVFLAMIRTMINRF